MTCWVVIGGGSPAPPRPCIHRRTNKNNLVCCRKVREFGETERDDMRINGQFVSNVLYLELVPQRLLEITYLGDGLELPVSTYKETGTLF